MTGTWTLFLCPPYRRNITPYKALLKPVSRPICTSHACPCEKWALDLVYYPQALLYDLALNGIFWSSQRSLAAPASRRRTADHADCGHVTQVFTSRLYRLVAIHAGVNGAALGVAATRKPPWECALRGGRSGFCGSLRVPPRRDHGGGHQQKDHVTSARTRGHVETREQGRVTGWAHQEAVLHALVWI